MFAYMRTSRLGSVRLTVAMAAMVVMLAGAASAGAYTTVGVYYDGNRNVAAGPNPFNATIRGGNPTLIMSRWAIR
jgi:hypothetical protein